MIVGIASDHHGVEIKKELMKFLNELGYTVLDYGTKDNTPVDYPDFAFKVGEAVASKRLDFGVLICNTGIGMSIACNKVHNVRCAHVSNVYEAEMTRLDNDSNVIAISAKIDIEQMKNIVNKFLSTEYKYVERHQRRIDKINNYGS